MKMSCPGKRVVRSRRDDRVGDAVEPRDRNVLGLRMKGVVDVHVGQDLIAGLDQIVAGLVGLDLGQAEVGLGSISPG